VRNSEDSISRRNGFQLLLDVAPASEGYATTFDVALQLV
jgi:hypothetical protein